MTEDLIIRTHRRASLRKLFYIPLAVGVLAGAVGAGTGIGAAASSDGVELAGTPTGSFQAPEVGTADHVWKLTNDQVGSNGPIWGELYKQQGSFTSTLTIPKNAPLALGQSSGAVKQISDVFYKEYTWGTLCFNHDQYTLPRKVYTNDSSELLFRGGSFGLAPNISFYDGEHLVDGFGNLKATGSKC
ncbi:hypothetical protein R3Q06_28025 [Rhodococcus erythropolis]|uniref:hypothetical protein n=1 Tax=Rhodococcus erythropolis TaxID=1833 RepID=UPI0029494A21|nr:hypothetical protein [Rhodococcus erythropolis]MDV6277350.1 hypothetical protein [Rhodococcus erythropolis]